MRKLPTRVYLYLGLILEILLQINCLCISISDKFQYSWKIISRVSLLTLAVHSNLHFSEHVGPIRLSGITFFDLASDVYDLPLFFNFLEIFFFQDTGFDFLFRNARGGESIISDWESTLPGTESICDGWLIESTLGWVVNN